MGVHLNPSCPTHLELSEPQTKPLNPDPFPHPHQHLTMQNQNPYPFPPRTDSLPPPYYPPRVNNASRCNDYQSFFTSARTWILANDGSQKCVVCDKGYSGDAIYRCDSGHCKFFACFDCLGEFAEEVHDVKGNLDEQGEWKF